MLQTIASVDGAVINHKPYWWDDAQQAIAEGWHKLWKGRPTGRPPFNPDHGMVC